MTSLMTARPIVTTPRIPMAVFRLQPASGNIAHLVWSDSLLLEVLLHGLLAEHGPLIEQDCHQARQVNKKEDNRDLRG